MTLFTTTHHAAKTVFRPFLKDRLLHILLILGLGLIALMPTKISAFPQFIDWTTIVTLLGLMLLTKGVEVSGYFDFIGRKIINTLQTERHLALFLVLSAAVLSSFLTNDVALFIIVPLILTLKKISALPVSRLIIFSALAVNAGSLLTPIGNPQNILLWSRSELSFIGFTLQMAPLAATILLTLLAVTWWRFPARKISKQTSSPVYPYQSRLLLSCLALYVIFIICVDFGWAVYGLLVVFAGLLLLARRVLLAIDWSLIVVFMAMFIDVRLLTELPGLQSLFGEIKILSAAAAYILGIGLSQVISNVPATILLLNYLPSSVLVAYAVNIGGFGFALGSMANLIALRMAGEPAIWLKFHAYSLPFLFWSGLVGWLLLVL
ncbi:TPA: anion permease [Yersinia enterocolitica]|uniref:SLC13 family permease n=1 Tax=Yersinia enterocolitica TaxID=630 RepID=UPI000200B413|nr:SLC13 family permease [Yersinia enterocolitica]ADZ43305.1 putative inner membrane protein [Yersinia enterocolitica subsp. palearctica 105.5R(r)]ALG79398.1 membrane protein [Yersinia enterocolitica]KGA72427.1 inner membrane protein YbiR [Yersinia enterocolitica]MDA5485402.1 SLC13 family permease [Yersinia enterocolitica]NGN38135.1 anion transporter [Yersinia enterocolitica subsp. palearctica]